jgi:hypothetical protein
VLPITPGTYSSQRKPWESNPQAARPPPAFQAGSSAVRMASVEFRGVESNHRPPGSGPGVTTSSNYPGSLSLRDTARLPKVRGGGVEPPSPGSRPGSLPLADPRSRSRVPCGSRTHLASLEGWHLCRSAKGTSRRKERESNPQGSSLGRFRGGCHRQLACPSVFLQGSSRRNRTSIPCLTGRSITVIGCRITVSQDGRI